MSKRKPSIAQRAQRAHYHRLGSIKMTHELLQWLRINYPDMPWKVDRLLYKAQDYLNEAYQAEAGNNYFIAGK